MAIERCQHLSSCLCLVTQTMGSSSVLAGNKGKRMTITVQSIQGHIFPFILSFLPSTCISFLPYFMFYQIFLFFLSFLSPLLYVLPSFSFLPFIPLSHGLVSPFSLTSYFTISFFSSIHSFLPSTGLSFLPYLEL